MSLSKLKPKQGRLLVSEPFLSDGYFKRSVILLTEHNEQGSLGFIINKPINLRLNDVVKDFPAFEAPLFMGGPVNRDSLFFIHTAGDRLEDSREITRGLSWGGDFGILKELVRTNRIRPGEIRFFVGYSGWGPRQLSKELKQQSWIVSGSRVSQIMRTDTDSLWKDILRGMGAEYAILANFPENPSLN